MVKYFKVLDENGCSCHGGEAEWSLPQRNDDGTWTPGEWMPEIEGELKPCRNGYHVVTLEQLPMWLSERVFEVEVGDEIMHEDDKLVTRTCRLTRECTGWNERTARLFACDCAEHVLSLYEAKYPDDDRPRKAIEVARRYAEGTATREELAAARDAAREAAWAAAGAAREAAWAARDAAEAAREAAGDAARAATLAAALDAAEAARAASLAAVWAAAGAAAGAAAEDAAGAAWEAAWAAEGAAAGAAARAAEQQWQVERLGEILEVEA
jgi:hypothetical protein